MDCKKRARDGHGAALGEETVSATVSHQDDGATTMGRPVRAANNAGTLWIIDHRGLALDRRRWKLMEM